MSKKRYISTSFWDDEWVSSLTKLQRYAYLYFMTNSLTNISGIYEITKRRMCFDTGFTQEEVLKVISDFQSQKKLFYLSGHIIIPTWPRHQSWENKSTIKAGIEKSLKDLPDKVFYDIVRYRIDYKYPISALLIKKGYNPSYLEFDLNLNSDINIYLDKDSKKIDSDKESSLLNEVEDKVKENRIKRSEY